MKLRASFVRQNKINFHFYFVLCSLIRTFAGALGKGNGVRVPNCPAAVSSHVKDANNIVTDIVGKTFAV